MRTFQPDYTFDQIKAEVLRKGSKLHNGSGVYHNDWQSATRRLKANGVSPGGHPFEWLLARHELPLGQDSDSVSIDRGSGRYLPSAYSRAWRIVVERQVAKEVAEVVQAI